MLNKVELQAQVLERHAEIARDKKEEFAEVAPHVLELSAKTIRALQQQVNTLTEALKFYADPKTYRLGVQITMGSAFPLHEPIKSDKGERASLALQSIKDKQTNRNSEESKLILKGSGLHKPRGGQTL